MPTIDLGSVVGPQGAQGNTGPQGPQGVAGPSLISSTTQTTLNGVLAGDGSVVGIRGVDVTPANTTNLVQSNGVYASLADKTAKSDIASISITGSSNNTGSLIRALTYFYKDGTLVQSIADISAGATLTLDTNYRIVSKGGLNEALAPVLLLNQTITATGSYNLSLSPRLFNMFIVRMEGNWSTYHTLVVSPGVSTECNVDANASLYVHATFKINLNTDKFDVEAFSHGGAWTGLITQVWGIALPLS